ncbi:MAG: DEAD/DEAH box helicase family protein [Treponema sp.]|nr:DEAD/DEAH box helicase family protein [Treponema sp.]
MDIHTRFTQSVITSMRRDVIEAGGNEVFWVGIINSAGLVTDVKTGSRGNIDSVIINSNMAREGHVLIHNHPSGNLYPSQADQNVAANATDTSLGFYIVNNDITDVYAVVEPIKPKVLEKLDADSLAICLSSKGPLSKIYEQYEERPSQIALLKNIADAFNNNKIAVFEAGTGVGKSYAYLIPSMVWAVKNKERVIVSTGTINLQQQLIEKDIPAAEKILGINVKSILLKGRQNYVCLRRLAEAGNERDLFSEETSVFDSIASWAKNSETGSKSDLSFVPSESIWSKINSESDACMGMRCQYREQCFVMKVRKEAADANIIVVNHHLLFADIESRMNGSGYSDAAVLPPYRHIVFDEAHGIEDSATSFFSESIDRFKLAKQLNLLYRTSRNAITGFLVQVSVVIHSDDFLQKCASAVNQVKSCMLELDESALEILETEMSARINESSSSGFENVFTGMKNICTALQEFTGVVRNALENLDDDDKELPAVWESKTVIRRLEDYMSLCKSFCEWNEQDDMVFYIQKKKFAPKKVGDDFIVFVEFTKTPLDVAPLMNQGVFEPMNSVVCTSATLKTGRTFGYWMRRTGISFVDEERLAQQEFASPFPYGSNVIFAVPNDAPFPDNSFEFQRYVEDSLIALIKASNGRTLVLFTSYDSLKHAYLSSRIVLENYGFSVFKQGDDDRFRLLERFKNDCSSVLFATDSFWEGVDVPGESLSQVIIVKLPFSVPNDPVFAARSEAVEKRGGSSFMELSVPQAVIKFRQGFGRLIRRGDDRGVVVVLDRRIVEKKYGKIFTESVPKTRRMYNPLHDIVLAEKQFFFSGH